ncbi:biopolymer transporter ExbD [Francisella sp. LA112445]|uniref:ExbD/TolR family protein n=1 Tax=Francisella sp. LA112445 TaxID=1395624 RepID=UPI001788E432|nr:biopolymer transporter ExbD [Francisella sp. LA112445]QIW10983.1 hypothetical protein FIP56_09850 [Francisella sp. LA112445]
MISSTNKSHNSSLELDEPNLIPLLDFMLVLLVMFVLLAGPVQHILKLPLPEVKGQAVSQSKALKMTVYIKSSKNFLVNNNHFDSLDDLQRYLKSIQKNKDLREIEIAADKKISLQNMLEIFAAIKELGLTTADIQVTK